MELAVAWSIQDMIGNAIFMTLSASLNEQGEKGSGDETSTFETLEGGSLEELLEPRE